MASKKKRPPFYRAFSSSSSTSSNSSFKSTASQEQSNRLERGDETATRILPSLYIGPRSSASASSFITSHGISHILSIGSTPSSQVPGVIYHRLSLADSSSESISIRRVCQKAGEIIDAVVGVVAGDGEDALRDARQRREGSARRGGNILVHCSAGISRSPTVVTAYLMTRHQMTLRDALGLIVGARPSTCPNPGFLAQLKDLEEEIFGKQTMKSIEQLPSLRAERVALFTRPELMEAARSESPKQSSSVGDSRATTPTTASEIDNAATDDTTTDNAATDNTTFRQ